jgi:hypothetical protein
MISLSLFLSLSLSFSLSLSLRFLRLVLCHPKLLIEDWTLSIACYIVMFQEGALSKLMIHDGDDELETADPETVPAD